MDIVKKVITYVFPPLLLLTSLAGCTLMDVQKLKTSVTNPSATELTELEKVISQLPYSVNTKALIDELYTLPKTLQVHKTTLNYLKRLAKSGKVTYREIGTSTNLSGLQRLDHDGDGFNLQEETVNGTDPLMPNPNVKYAIENGLRPFISQIMVLDDDGKQDESEKFRIDTVIKVIPAIKDFPQESIKEIVASIVNSPNRAGACNKLVSISNKSLSNMIITDMDENSFTYVDYVSSLPDSEWVRYVFENKLCIQDKSFTELEKRFLQEPDKYLGQLFDTYRVQLYSASPEVAAELLKLNDFSYTDTKRVEALEDWVGLLSKPENKGAIDKFMDVGIKDKRTQWTPGEQITWLAYDRELDDDRLNPLNYDEKKLTTEAWENTTESDKYTSVRWQGFNEVFNRLNSPYLVNVYLAKRFFRMGKPNVLFVEPITELFKNKSGDYDEYARLALYPLALNGYNAYLLIVQFDKYLSEWNKWIEYDICIYQDEDNSWYYFDMNDFRNNPKGPYISIDAMCSQLAGYYGASKWINYGLYDSKGKVLNKTVNRG